MPPRHSMSPPAPAAHIAALRERKLAFARARGGDFERCENDACAHDGCECGATCECETPLPSDIGRERRTCEACVEAKARRVAAQA